MTPQVVLMVKAISDAQRVLAAHREYPDASATVISLIRILDDRDLMAAVRAVAAAGP